MSFLVVFPLHAFSPAWRAAGKNGPKNEIWGILLGTHTKDPGAKREKLIAIQSRKYLINQLGLQLGPLIGHIGTRQKFEGIASSVFVSLYGLQRKGLRQFYQHWSFCLLAVFCQSGISSCMK